MLHLVRANTPYTVIILLILTLALKLQALGDPVMPAAGVHFALYGQIIGFLKPALGGSKTAFTVLALLMTFGQALYLRFIAMRHRLFLKPTYVPAFVFLMLSALHPLFGQFGVHSINNWLILLALDAMLHFARREDQPRTIYNAGFALGCSALLAFPAVFMLFTLIGALLLLRPFKGGEWIIGILGWLTPAYFALGLLYLFNGMSAIVLWPALSFSLPPTTPHGAYLPVVISVVVVLIAAGIWATMRILFKMPVSTRRSWIAVGFTAIISLLMCIAAPRTQDPAWAGLLPLCSLVISPAMGSEKRNLLATFTFYLLAALVVFAQLALRR